MMSSPLLCVKRWQLKYCENRCAVLCRKRRLNGLPEAGVLTDVLAYHDILCYNFHKYTLKRFVFDYVHIRGNNRCVTFW